MSGADKVAGDLPPPVGPLPSVTFPRDVSSSPSSNSATSLSGLSTNVDPYRKNNYRTRPGEKNQNKIQISSVVDGGSPHSLKYSFPSSSSFSSADTVNGRSSSSMESKSGDLEPVVPPVVNPVSSSTGVVSSEDISLSPPGRAFYESRTVAQLKSLCKIRGIKKYGKLKKSLLVDLLLESIDQSPLVGSGMVPVQLGPKLGSKIVSPLLNNLCVKRSPESGHESPSNSNLLPQFRGDYFNFFQQFSIESVFSHRVNSISFIHPQLKDLLSDALFPVIQSMFLSLSPDADPTPWKVWALFPFMVLCTTRGGAGHDAKAEIRCNLKHFIAGDFSFLYDKACRHESLSNKYGGDYEARSGDVSILRAEVLAGAGDFGAAFDKLTSEAVLKQINEKEFLKLQSMHPIRKSVPFPEVPVTEESVDFLDSIEALDLLDISNVIKRLPNKRAHDSLGFCYEHFKSLVFTRCFSRLCSLMASIGNLGSLPVSVAPFFAGATLFGLSKPGDPEGVRPIAVSLCFRRVVGKALMAKVASRAGSFFHPLQFGVAVRSGTDSVAFVIRHFMEADSRFSIWSHDARNAFNSVSRDAIRNGLELHFPEQLPFFDLCYQCVGRLRVFRSDLMSFQWVESSEGTQQGDPLGPFYFALALQPILNKVRVQFPEVLVMSYIDDVNLGGYPESVIRAANLLNIESSFIGLQSNMDKCLFWQSVNSDISLSSFTSSSLVNSIFLPPDPPPDVSSISVASVLDQHADVDGLLKSFHLSPKRVSEGVKVLGVPCGTPEFIHRSVSCKTESIRNLLAKLSHFQNLQSALHMIRYVSSSSMVYLSRNILPSLLLPHCGLVDELVKSSSAKLFNYGMEWDSKDWAYLSLPRKLGSPGVGLTSSVSLAPVHFASANYYFHHNTLITNSYISNFFSHSFTLPHSSSLFEANLAANSLIAQYPLKMGKSGAVANKISKQIATTMHTIQVKDFINSPVWSQMDRARILSQCQFGANNWLYAIPSDPFFSIRSHLFPIVIHNWIGSVFPLSQAPNCVCKRKVVLDPLGYHLKVCSVGKCITTHNNCVDVLGAMARSAGHQVSVANAIHHIHEDSDKVPDLNIHSRIVWGKDKYIDLRIANPAIHSAPSQFSSVPLAAASNAENVKEKKHGPACRLMGSDFDGFGIEYYGAFGVKAKSLFEILCSEIDADSFSPPNWAANSVSSYWLQRFSVVLQSSNADRILHLRQLTMNAHGKCRSKI